MCDIARNNISLIQTNYPLHLKILVPCILIICHFSNYVKTHNKYMKLGYNGNLIMIVSYKRYRRYANVIKWSPLNLRKKTVISGCAHTHTHKCRDTHSHIFLESFPMLQEKIREEKIPERFEIYVIWGSHLLSFFVLLRAGNDGRICFTPEAPEMIFCCKKMSYAWYWLEYMAVISEL